MLDLLDYYIASLLSKGNETNDIVLSSLHEAKEGALVKLLFSTLDSSEVHVAIIEAIMHLSDERVVPTLIEVMRSSRRSDEVRLAAINVLGQSSDGRIIPALLDLLKNAQIHDEVRIATIRALVQLSDPRIVPALIEELKNPQRADEVQSYLVGLFVQLPDERIVPTLIEKLEDPTCSVKLQSDCIAALAQRSDARATGILVEKTRWPSPQSLQRSAIEALAHMQQPQAVKPLLQLFKSSTISSRRNLLEIARRNFRNRWAVEQIIDLLDDRDLSPIAIEFIGELRQETEQCLVAALPAKRDRAYADCINILIDWKAFASLVAALDTPDHRKRQTIIELLLPTQVDPGYGFGANSMEESKYAPHKELIEALILGLMSENTNVVAGSADILLELGKSSTKIMCRRFENERAHIEAQIYKSLSIKDRVALRAAIHTLGKIGVGPATSELIRFLGHEDSLLSQTALKAMDGMEAETPPEAVSYLVKIVKDDYPYRLVALRLLLRQKWGSKYPPEINWLDTVRNLIAEPLLALLRYPSSARDAYKSEERWKVVIVLGLLGDESAVDPLSRILDDQDEKLRASAARSLGMLKDARDCFPLIKALVDRGSYYGENAASIIYVRGVVASALGELGTLEALAPLAITLQDEQPLVQRAAATAIATLMKGQNIDRLIEARILRPIHLIENTESLVQQLEVDFRAHNSGFLLVSLNLLRSIEPQQALEPLTLMLQEKTSIEKQLGIVKALGMLRSFEAAVLLINLLSSPHSQVRSEAVISLQMVEDQASVALRLRDELKITINSKLGDSLSDIDKKKCLVIIEMLGKMGDEKAGSDLIAVLKLDDDELRYAAVKAIGELHIVSDVPALLKLATGGTSTLALCAVSVLGSMEVVEAIGALIPLLNSREAPTRSKAADSLLANVNYPKLVKKLIVGNEEHNTINQLVAATRKQETEVKVAAIIGLGETDSVEAIVPILTTLKEIEAPDPQLRDRLIHSVGNLTSRQTIHVYVWCYLTHDIWGFEEETLAKSLYDFLRAEFAIDEQPTIAPLESTILRAISGEFDLALRMLEYFDQQIKSLPQGVEETLLRVSRFCFELAYIALERLTLSSHDARRLVAEIVEISRSLGNMSTVWQGLRKIGQLIGETRYALDIYEDIVSLIARAWHMEPIEEANLRRFFRDKALIYDELALDYYNIQASIEAWKTLEGAKTRYLADLIARRQYPPKEQLSGLLEAFWANVRQARSPAYDPSHALPQLSAGESEVVGVTIEQSPGVHTTAVPKQLSALRNALDNLSDPLNYYEYQRMEKLINGLWIIAGQLSGHQLSDSVRNAFVNIYQLAEGLLKRLRTGRDDPSLNILEAWLDNGHQSLLKLGNLALSDIQEVGEQERLNLWQFTEFDGHLRDLIRSNFEGSYKADSNFQIMELEALREVLTVITGREESVFVVSRPNTDRQSQPIRENGAPTVSFRTRAPGSVPAYHSGFAQVEGEMIGAWQRLSRTRWEYVRRLARGDIVTYVELRRDLLNQPDGALVEFHVTEHGTLIYIFCAGDMRNRNIYDFNSRMADETIKLIPIENFQLSDLNGILGEAWVNVYRNARQNNILKPFMDAVEQVPQAIYDKLLEPVDNYLSSRGVKRVTLVPHRGLHLIPLHACRRWTRRGRRYLMEDYEITYAPSSTIAHICKKRVANHLPYETFTAFVNPTDNLPFFEYEVTRAEDLFSDLNVKTVRNEKATLEAVKGMQDRPSILHFACHGLYNWSDPLNSCLQLAGDNKTSVVPGTTPKESATASTPIGNEGQKPGRLEKSEANLTLEYLFGEALDISTTRLVVLSACETNITDPEDLADEYLGLTSGFLFAGVPTVVSTLWAVDEISSGLLLTHFYENHITKGMRPADALREAQSWIRQKVTVSYVKKEIRNLLTKLEAQYSKAGSDEMRTNIKSQIDRFDSYQSRPHMKGRSWSCPFERPYFWAGFMLSGIDVSD